MQSIQRKARVQKVDFPSWKALLFKVVRKAALDLPYAPQNFDAKCIDVANFLDRFSATIQEESKTFIPGHAYAQLFNSKS